MFGVHMHVHAASLIALIFILSFVAFPMASGAGYKVQYDAVVQGTVHINSDNVGRFGDNVDRVSSSDFYNAYSSGDVLLAAPGYNDYSYSAENDASVGNRFTKSDSKDLQNGGVFSNTLATQMSTPNQSPLECTASQVAYGKTGATSIASDQYTDAEATTITSGKTISKMSGFVNGMNSSFSQQNAWDGAGFHTGSVTASGEVGGNNSSTTGNYKVDTHTHIFTSTNATPGSGAQSRLNFEWNDYRDAFVTNVTNSTSTNVSVNQT